MLQPYLISMANYVCYFQKTVLCLAPLAAVALEKDRSASASPAVVPMAGHKAQLRCPLSLSGAVITVTPSPPQNLAASHASEPWTVLVLGSLLFQGPGWSGPGCEFVSWTLHNTLFPALHFCPELALEGFCEEILPWYFYYMCNLPVLYWERTFLKQDIQGNF